MVGHEDDSAARARRTFAAVQGVGLTLVLVCAGWAAVAGGPGILWALGGGVGLALAGYLTIAVFLGRCADPARVRALGGLGYGGVTATTFLLLVALALRLPLVALALGGRVHVGWAVGALVLSALAATLVLAVIVSLRPREPRGWWEGALVGGLALFARFAALDVVLAVSLLA